MTGILERKSPYEDEIIDPSQHLLETLNIDRVNKLAHCIREESGLYRFGPMWAEKTTWLADDRKALLQVSQNSLVIRIQSSQEIPFAVNASYDRKRKIINTYSEWDTGKNKFLLYYQIFENLPSIPENFSYAQAARKFSEILEMIGRPVNQPNFLTLAQVLTMTS